MPGVSGAVVVVFAGCWRAGGGQVDGAGLLTRVRGARLSRLVRRLASHIDDLANICTANMMMRSI